MAEIKTKQTEVDVTEFINTFANTDQKKLDAHNLVQLMQEWTGFEAKMWGPSIIGFGQYHYKSAKSRQEGDWPIVGFSPRKAAISLYVYSGTQSQDDLLLQLGKYKMGKSCIYIRKLDDINLIILRELVLSTVQDINSQYPTQI